VAVFAYSPPYFRNLARTLSSSRGSCLGLYALAGTHCNGRLDKAFKLTHCSHAYRSSRFIDVAPTSGPLTNRWRWVIFAVMFWAETYSLSRKSNWEQQSACFRKELNLEEDLNWAEQSASSPPHTAKKAYLLCERSGLQARKHLCGSSTSLFFLGAHHFYSVVWLTRHYQPAPRLSANIMDRERTAPLWQCHLALVCGNCRSPSAAYFEHLSTP